MGWWHGGEQGWVERRSGGEVRGGEVGGGLGSGGWGRRSGMSLGMCDDARRRPRNLEI